MTIPDNLLHGEEMPRSIQYLPTPEEIEAQKRSIREHNLADVHKSKKLEGNGKNGRKRHAGKKP